MIRNIMSLNMKNENYPKTPEHFKQFVAAQVEKELKQTSIVRHRARKKYFPAKVADCRDCLRCRRHYRRICRSKTLSGKITAVFAGNRTYHCSGNSSEEETPAISYNTDSVSPATIVSEENGLITTFLTPGRMYAGNV